MFWEVVGVVITSVAVLVAAYPLGLYMAKVFTGTRTILSGVVGPVERLIYRLIQVKEDSEQKWTAYLGSLLMVTIVGVLVTFLMLRFQDKLPLQSQLNPQHFAGLSPDLAMNTAISFATNTNWQNYAGEASMSYLSQMVALVLHNFLSAATGIALAIALIRGLARRSASTLGNFYVDMVKSVLYILLPLSIVGALIFASQGVIQSFANYTTAHTLGHLTQVIPQGPLASQEIIKDLGNNGGGPFNANSAHPFENPTGFTNAFTIFALLLIPFALTITFGKMVRNIKQGFAVMGAMAIILFGFTAIAAYAEQHGNPALTNVGVTQASTTQQDGGNMEGKEVRFGALQSAEFAAATTGTSTGSVDSSHDSYTPLGGLVPLLSIQLGEITPGGVGAGLYGMLTFAIVAVFIAGLMVGRTPEYLGKKIESRDIKLAALAILILPASILGFTTIAVLTSGGAGIGGGGGPLNSGAHGFTEILYAYSSATGNNGSAFAGLTGNTVFYNTTLELAMWLGRFVFVIPILALAGSMARKKTVPASAGTFPTDGPLFAVLVVGVVIIVGALTFFPALALGPILEHFNLAAGHLH